MSPKRFLRIMDRALKAVGIPEQGGDGCVVHEAGLLVDEHVCCNGLQASLFFLRIKVEESVRHDNDAS